MRNGIEPLCCCTHCARAGAAGATTQNTGRTNRSHLVLILPIRSQRCVSRLNLTTVTSLLPGPASHFPIQMSYSSRKSRTERFSLTVYFDSIKQTQTWHRLLISTLISLQNCQRRRRRRQHASYIFRFCCSTIITGAQPVTVRAFMGLRASTHVYPQTGASLESYASLNALMAHLLQMKSIRVFGEIQELLCLILSDIVSSCGRSGAPQC